MTPQEEKEKPNSKLGLVNVCWEKKTNITTKLNKNIINGREWKERVKKMEKMRRVKKKENGKRVRKAEKEKMRKRKFEEK